MKKQRLSDYWTERSSVVGYLLLIASAVCLSYALSIRLHHRQSAVWTAPFLSASNNLSLPPAFRINPEEVSKFINLSTVWEQETYQFASTAPLTSYRSNDIGYAYLIWLAAKLFPHIGQQSSVILLQITIHLLICLYLLTSHSLPKKWKRYFLWLYAVNPIILLYVTYNHYYFWQVIPAFAVVILTTQPLHPCRWVLFAVVVILPWAILARSSTLLLVPILIFLLYQNLNFRKASVFSAYLVLVLFYFHLPSQKNPWHTAYIGVGAYQNEWGIRLSDDSGYELARSLPDFNQAPQEGEWVNTPDYRAAAKYAFLQQVRNRPFLYLKNALVNSLLSFGTGYYNGGSDRTNYLLALTGLFTLWVLVTRRSWIILAALFLAGIGFTLYYPPVPAYMYGHYLLIVYGLLNAWFLPPKQGDPQRILYLSLNDGSDTRINKEVKTLVNSGARVDYMGIGPSKTHCFVKYLPLQQLYFTTGNRKSVITLFKYFGRAIRLLLSGKYHSVHVVNEPQLAILWPFLMLQRRVVADLFDSVFLRINQPGNKWATLKRLLYFPADRVVVTDSNRLMLLPRKVKNKAVVLPNYPSRIAATSASPVKPVSGPLTILSYGWLGRQRGNHLLKGLMNAGYPIQVLMAGWIADNSTWELIKHPQVRWFGTVPQEKSHEIAATCDFILCVYAPVNANNINASPNKIFDAIQVGKPVITNAEIAPARFVSENNLGVVIPDYYHTDYRKLYDTLVGFQNNYRPNPVLRAEYCWDKVEHILWDAHQP